MDGTGSKFHEIIDERPAPTPPRSTRMENVFFILPISNITFHGITQPSIKYTRRNKFWITDRREFARNCRLRVEENECSGTKTFQWKRQNNFRFPRKHSFRFILVRNECEAERQMFTLSGVSLIHRKMLAMTLVITWPTTGRKEGRKHALISRRV